MSWLASECLNNFVMIGVRAIGTTVRRVRPSLLGPAPCARVLPCATSCDSTVLLIMKGASPFVTLLARV